MVCCDGDDGAFTPALCRRGGGGGEQHRAPSSLLMTCEKQLHGLLIGGKTVFTLKTAVEPKSWQGRAPITGVDTTVGASETCAYLQPAGRDAGTRSCGAAVQTFVVCSKLAASSEANVSVFPSCLLLGDSATPRKHVFSVTARSPSAPLSRGLQRVSGCEGSKNNPVTYHWTLSSCFVSVLLGSLAPNAKVGELHPPPGWKLKEALFGLCIPMDFGKAAVQIDFEIKAVSVQGRRRCSQP